jgi:hypothetical protein
MNCNQGRDCPAREPVLLVSPALYFGLLFSVGVWTALALWLLS